MIASIIRDGVTILKRILLSKSLEIKFEGQYQQLPLDKQLFTSAAGQIRERRKLCFVYLAMVKAAYHNKG